MLSLLLSYSLAITQYLLLYMCVCNDLFSVFSCTRTQSSNWPITKMYHIAQTTPDTNVVLEVLPAGHVFLQGIINTTASKGECALLTHFLLCTTLVQLHAHTQACKCAHTHTHAFTHTLASLTLIKLLYITFTIYNKKAQKKCTNT